MRIYRYKKTRKCIEAKMNFMETFVCCVLCVICDDDYRKDVVDIYAVFDTHESGIEEEYLFVETSLVFGRYLFHLN